MVHVMSCDVHGSTCFPVQGGEGLGRLGTCDRAGSSHALDWGCCLLTHVPLHLHSCTAVELAPASPPHPCTPAGMWRHTWQPSASCSSLHSTGLLASVDDGNGTAFGWLRAFSSPQLCVNQELVHRLVRRVCAAGERTEPCPKSSAEMDGTIAPPAVFPVMRAPRVERLAARHWSGMGRNAGWNLIWTRCPREWLWHSACRALLGLRHVDELSLAVSASDHDSNEDRA